LCPVSGYIGCTTEFRKWEGITFDAQNRKLYTAISSVEYGMEDNMKKGSANTQYDLGTPNSIKVKYNSCGCVMEMDVDHHMMATKARMLTCGAVNTDPATKDEDFCVTSHIANPDNVAMIPDYNQLIIGEDTSNHKNNLIWIYDLASHRMTRVAHTPVGAETTSPYWYTVGNFNYMAYVVQHPRSDVTGYEAHTGYVGPFPRFARPAASWVELQYPMGDAKHKVLSSPMVTIDSIGETGKIEYHWLYRSGDTHGEETAAAIVTKAGTADRYVYKFAEDGESKGTEIDVSHNPDFTSILNIDGKIFSITQFESPRPGVAYLSELEQDPHYGTLSVKQMKPLDFSAHGGVWIPCAGSVTPWETHLGSEEYEPNAKAFYEADGDLGSSWVMSNIHAFMRYFGKYEAKTGFTKEKAMEGGFYPYRYGYPWETVVNADFTETTTKLYAHGRLAYEMSYVMPDEKTVYGTDDGTNVMFSMFIANEAQNIHEGTAYCAKYIQTSPEGCEAEDWTADIEWIATPVATAEELEAAIETTTFADLFDSEACNDDGSCPSDGFVSVNQGGIGCECLKVVDGAEKFAQAFEKRRYAGT